jgi:hypothetical protein
VSTSRLTRSRVGIVFVSECSLGYRIPQQQSEASFWTFRGTSPWAAALTLSRTCTPIKKRNIQPKNVKHVLQHLSHIVLLALHAVNLFYS